MEEKAEQRQGMVLENEKGDKKQLTAKVVAYREAAEQARRALQTVEAKLELEVRQRQVCQQAAQQAR